jgi:hypothetical protein
MGSLIDHYEVDGKTASQPYSIFCSNTVTSCRLTGLSDGTDYTVKVRAHNGVGFGNWSDEYTFHTNQPNATVPDSPSNLTTVDVERTFAVLGWNAPDDDGGAEVLDYHVQIAEDSGFQKNPLIIASNGQLTLTVKDLQTSSAYYARVRGKNLVGEGNWSTAVEFTTPAAGIPLAPQKMEILATSPTWLEVQWDIPDDQGSAITSFEVAMDNGWFGYPIQSVVNTSDTKANITDNLVPASVYNFETRAYNEVGAGAWSNSFQFRTDQIGSCGNAGDVTIFAKLRNTIRPSIQSSFFRCIASGEECAINDIVKNTGLTHDCATCWGNLGECSLSNCIGPCLDPKSKACEDCSKQKCFPACQTCTGLPMWLLWSLPS